MRPLLLGFAAVALFLGSVMMAPLTSDVTMKVSPVGEIVDFGLPNGASAAI